MFFSRISGLWRDENDIFISAEYHNIKFHVNEIETVQIIDKNDAVITVDDLPVRNVRVQFILKSGRKKICYVRKLTKRKYKWLLNLLDAQQ